MERALGFKRGLSSQAHFTNSSKIFAVLHTNNIKRQREKERFHFTLKEKKLQLLIQNNVIFYHFPSLLSHNKVHFDVEE